MSISAWKLLVLRVFLIVSAGLWVFAPALHGAWLMDDDMYLTQNVLLNDPHRLWKIWFVPGSLIEYYPIEASAQAIQWQLWQNNTLGYHLTNLALHLANALLVWRLLTKFQLRWAWIGGLLFAVHPVVVESVAWISELKNTLSLVPFLVAACAWMDYSQNHRRRDYLLALGFFLLAMLCKISMALFPFVILLLAWWKNGRVTWRDGAASLPFFAISLMLGTAGIVVGSVYQHAHLQSVNNPVIGSVASHLALAGLSLSFYFVKGVCPFGMLPFYPQWPVNPPSPLQFLPWPVLALAFGFLWTRRETWGRHAVLGLGFFLINLAPFLGLNSVSYMQFSWVMDHFLYIPVIGLIGLAVAGAEHLHEILAPPQRPLLVLVMAGTLATLALGSHQYAALFIDQETLWTYTVEHNPGASLAHNNLGNIYLLTDRARAAIVQYEAALQTNPNMPEAHNNLGHAFDELGQESDAIAQYEAALRSNPNFALAHANLADVLMRLGRFSEAIPHEEAILRINPHDEKAHAELDRLHAKLKTTPSGSN